ncbi:MAG: hypothetical protein Q8P10_02540 [bacterium]|nr:hypothetical protein [bacterium]
MDFQDRIFIFKGYKSEIKKGSIIFQYEIKDKNKSLEFSEEIRFKPPQELIQQDPLKSVLDNLLLILGISYWKLYCPMRMQIKPFSLTKEQADFWNIVYTKGLGEFFYKNKIDFRNLVQFPYSSHSEFSSESKMLKLVQHDNGAKSVQANRSLLLFGGGKDSIISAEFLKEQKKDFELFVFGNGSKIQEDVARKIGKEPIVIKREIDFKLFELNKKKDVYNGHVPISAVYAFTGVLASFLYGFKDVISSNEKSANFGNVEYLGETINHQWSKSIEFEKLFQDYVNKYISNNISYYSMLRPFSEIKIAELFSKYPQYFPLFSSCNRNFTIQNKNMNDKWCNKCPKCVFVFTLLAAVISKKDLLGIFKKNLFAEQKLKTIFKELLGIENFKPFECVGTPQEMKEAMHLVYKKNEFRDDIVMKMFENTIK